MSQFADLIDEMEASEDAKGKPTKLVFEIEEALGDYLKHGPYGEKAEAACLRIACNARLLWEGDF